MQKEMVLKFRDSAIAAQRRKDPEAEKAAMTEEIAYLQKELSGSSDRESLEVKSTSARATNACHQCVCLFAQSGRCMHWSPQLAASARYM